RYLTELYTVSYLIFFAIMGTLARLGTQWITFYPGTPIVTPVIWANFAGSFIFGFLAEDQALFRQDSRRDRREEEKQMNASAEDRDRRKAELTKRKKAIPLYIGLATGFCGSYTSFSSFTRDVFLALSNSLPTPVNHPHPGIVAPAPSSAIARHDGYSFEAFLQVIIFTIALSIGGLIIGAQVAAFADPITPRIHGRFVRKFVDPAAVFLGFGCWLGSIFLAIWPPDRPGGPLGDTSWAQEKWRGEVLFALVFAPLGCLLRFYVSLKLNGLVPAFPLGTFAVNMFGTAIEGMCYDLQHVGVGIMGGLGGGRIGCQVLQGVQDGFCGCLTTVSTWVGEINGLRRKHGWGYAFASVLGGFCLMVVIMGSVRWSVGFSGTVCDTGYPNKVHG
ncbi:CrcB-like protein-domain-containing protein, partial [Neohortaea acidophila]